MSDSNPFATRFTRPGAIEYVFPAGQSVATVVAQLADQGWWGEIVGPHGSGKSTLLAALAPALRKAGRRVTWRAIRAGREGEASAEPLVGRESAKPQEVVAAKFAEVVAGSDEWDASTQLVLDGYEQLSWWWRRRVQALVRRRGAGLLVTAHEPLGLPTLATIKPSEAVAQQVVTKLIGGQRAAVTPADVSQAFAASGQNMRETLFALYDVHQSRK
jgi:energy-coupling factor transporter ATP-binding protein EcfA2